MLVCITEYDVNYLILLWINDKRILLKPSKILVCFDNIVQFAAVTTVNTNS